MPRVSLPISQINRSALTQQAQTNGDAVNNHQFDFNDGQVFLEVQASAGTVNITIVTPGTVDGLAVADLTLAVTNPAVKFIGPFPPAVYNQGDNTVQINTDSANARFRAYKL